MFVMYKVHLYNLGVDRGALLAVGTRFGVAWYGQIAYDRACLANRTIYIHPSEILSRFSLAFLDRIIGSIAQGSEREKTLDPKV